ncbi:MAG: ATP-binding cassette domain-containing protein [bacterium]
MSALAIETQDLARTFRVRKSRRNPSGAPIVALDGVGLQIPPGEVFGLLGPNGAGKTTLIKILVTLLLPTSGRASVDGFDVATQAQRVRERISMVSGGEHSGYGLLTVREQLWMFAQFYGIPTPEAHARIDRLLAIVGLSDARDRKVQELSTGMRQKMNLVRGLVSEPQILFLDEPTVGLDVEAGRDVRAYIKTWMEEHPGRTILLTTHYMSEAEELCDRVAIIHKGKIIATDTPAGLKRAAQSGSYFVLNTERLEGGTDFLSGLPGVARVNAAARDGHTELHVELADDGAIAGVVAALAQRGRRILRLQKVEPTLEEAFVALVGRRLEEADEARQGP